MEASLRLPRPFDVALTSEGLRRSSYGLPYHFSADGHTARRLMHLGDTLSLVEFHFVADKDDLRSRVLASQDVRDNAAVVSPEQLERVAYTMWGFRYDLAACYAVLGRDPELAPVVVRYLDMCLVRMPDLYETLLVAILGQQISVRAANACRLRIMVALGEHLDFEGNRYMTYPLPASLLNAGAEELRLLGTGKQKARYLLSLAQATLAGKLERNIFEGLSDEEAIALLCEIPGVGRWTAEVALLRGLGRVDAFPAGDLGLQVAAQHVLGLDGRPSERQLRAIAERWRPWRGYAALYLWGYLRDST